MPERGGQVEQELAKLILSTAFLWQGFVGVILKQTIRLKRSASFFAARTMYIADEVSPNEQARLAFVLGVLGRQTHAPHATMAMRRGIRP